VSPLLILKNASTYDAPSKVLQDSGARSFRLMRSGFCDEFLTSAGFRTSFHPKLCARSGLGREGLPGDGGRCEELYVEKELQL
jgi:hypothetical protein